MKSDIPDEILIEEIASGDTSAFKTIIERYQSLVLNIAFRFIGNPHDAEDIAQEAFLRLFQNANYYKPTAKFKTWFWRIVTNLCLDFLKKKKPVYVNEFFDIASDNPMSRENMELSERQRVIHKTIQSLISTQRMAVLLHYYEGLRYKEIAQVMGCSVKAVESLLVRAKQTLRKSLHTILQENFLR